MHSGNLIDVVHDVEAVHDHPLLQVVHQGGNHQRIKSETIPRIRTTYDHRPSIRGCGGSSPSVTSPNQGKTATSFCSKCDISWVVVRLLGQVNFVGDKTEALQRKALNCGVTVSHLDFKLYTLNFKL